MRACIFFSRLSVVQEERELEELLAKQRAAAAEAEEAAAKADRACEAARRLEEERKMKDQQRQQAAAAVEAAAKAAAAAKAGREQAWVDLILFFFSLGFWGWCFLRPARGCIYWLCVRRVSQVTMYAHTYLPVFVDQ